jgi:GntR family phosphonate transport system transcriptional regulator
LPGETEIAETYRVNRHTVRRALAALAERGLVRAERGSGTYVEARRLAYPLRSRTRFSEIVGAGGHEPRGQLIDAATDVATRELARELGLRTGAALIRIEALRFADRTPICVSTTWLAADRFPDAGRVFARLRSMTGLLAHYGINDYRRASTRISAAIAEATDAARLDLALGRPVLVVDSTDVDTNGSPLVTKRSRFAAERVEFLVENG